MCSTCRRRRTAARPRHGGLVGVIGGAGPAAAAHLASRVVDRSVDAGATGDSDHPPLLLWNVGAPGLDHSGVCDLAAVVAHLRTGASALAAAGADWLVVACNAAHAALDAEGTLAGLPVLDLVAATASGVTGHDTVGLIAAGSTLRSGLYQKALGPDVTLVTPAAAVVDALIADAMVGRVDPASLDAVVASLVADGASTVVLGCTELALYGRGEQRWAVPVVDSVEVAAHTIVAAHRHQIHTPPTTTAAPLHTDTREYA